MRKLTPLWFFALIFSCAENEQTSNEAFSDHVLIIDVENSAKTDQPLLIRDLFEEVSYIQPGSPDEFYLTDTKKILEFGDYLVVLDKNKGQVVAYDFEGNFRGLVGKKGDGPEEYIFGEDMDVQPERQSLLVFSNSGQALVHFDDEISPVGKFKSGVYASYFSILSSGNLGFYESSSGAGSLVHIISQKGKPLEQKGAFPSNQDLFSFDYTGFLKRDYYNWPLSSEIFRIREGKVEDEKIIVIKFPDQRPEEKKFQHREYDNAPYNEPNNEILWQWEIGESPEELIFYYGYRRGGQSAITIGFRLLSGQIFSHFNLNHGGPDQADEFLKMFFWNPYNIPTYSTRSGYFYIAATQEGWDNFHNQDKAAKLEKMKAIDPALYEALSKSSDTDNPIIMRFKLKKEVSR